MFRISHLDKKTNIVLENGYGETNTSEDYIREVTKIFWTFDTRKRKTKTTDGRKDRRVKTQRKAKKNLDK